MISDLDLYRAAAILVKRHGEDALVEAAMRADAMRRDARVSPLIVTPLMDCEAPWSLECACTTTMLKGGEP